MRKLKTIEMNRLSVNEFKSADKLPLTIVLDDVRSMYNVGSIFRTSDAFRVEKIMLCGITGCPPHPEIHKTALGAEDSIEWEYFKTTEEAVEQLKARGVAVYAIEQCEGSIMLNEIGTDSPSLWGESSSAIILGNEVKGVKQGVVDMCDGCIEIPQFGTKHSLNVASAGAIVIYTLWQCYQTSHC